MCAHASDIMKRVENNKEQGGFYERAEIEETRDPYRVCASGGDNGRSVVHGPRVIFIMFEVLCNFGESL